MKHIKPPLAATADKAVADKIAADPLLLPHKATWLGAYDTYRQHSGDPWRVGPLGYPSDVHERLYDLYDSRKSSRALNDIRQTKGLLSCPVCGSPTTGGLDHYLPRTDYPEFSIMRANLVPACTHCNSGSKSSTVKGATSPARFIHPYFDSWANTALWLVRPRAPFAAVTFQPWPMPGLSTRRKRIVKFHIDNVLGAQFHLSLSNRFATLPRSLLLNIGKKKIVVKDVERRLKTDLLQAIATNDINCWDAAFFRGILKSNSAIAYLHKRTLSLRSP
jgi:hypothetical protein